MLVRAGMPDLRLETALPMIRAVAFETMKKVPEVGQRFYRKASSKRDIEQFSEVSGLGLFAQIGEGSPMVYDAPVPGFSKTFKHVKYGLGFQYTEETVWFDKWGQVRDMTSQLGKSRMYTREVQAASVFNNAFTAGAYALPDGKALCASDHPLVKAGGTQSNLAALSADLDVESLELMLTQARKTKWHSGKYYQADPRTLLVAAEGEWSAIETLNPNMNMQSGTANNNVNPFQNRLGVNSTLSAVSWVHLTDPDAWFLLAEPEETDLWWFDAVSFRMQHEVDFDTGSAKHMGKEMYSFGPAGFRGVWGNPGA